MEHIEFVHLILDWYKKNQRDLPWRKEKDPYKIWLSEILLQQTRVSQGLPYYYKFINEFPNITSLAHAEEQKILRLWQGLGYYSRARNLRETAIFIVKVLNGNFPDTYKELLKLKGIGEYTAAAIASFAFGEKVAAIDGNVYRVLARVFGIDLPPSSTEGKKLFKKIANELLPTKETATYNQAMMEFGALQCTAPNPACINCPVAVHCFARKNEKQKELPLRKKTIEKKKRYFSYKVYFAEDHYILEKRDKNDIWKGLYQFPLLENTKQEVADRELKYTNKVYRQTLSHQIIEAYFDKIAVKNLNALKKIAKHSNGTIYSLSAVEELPKPVVINNYLKENIF